MSGANRYWDGDIEELVTFLAYGLQEHDPEKQSGKSKPDAWTFIVGLMNALVVWGSKDLNKFDTRVVKAGLTEEFYAKIKVDAPRPAIPDESWLPKELLTIILFHSKIDPYEWGGLTVKSIVKAIKEVQKRYPDKDVKMPNNKEPWREGGENLAKVNQGILWEHADYRAIQAEDAKKLLRGGIPFPAGSYEGGRYPAGRNKFGEYPAGTYQGGTYEAGIWYPGT
ncbi:hypothetical protein EAF04_000530 [Stromatinia cepivora]|nr:hypothetical protein EAF04_000530 [Stromatinia cepivora]